MSVCRVAIVLMMGFCFPFNVLAADITGLWKAHDDKGKPTGYIRISEESAIYIGIVEKGLASDKEEKFCTACKGERKGQRLIGMTIIKGVVAKGDNSYLGTEILDPLSGNTYRVKLKLDNSGQLLEVRGYVGISLFGRTQIWKRAENGQ
ncbi:MAG: DUF2147 domain-containing protein [Methylophilaceae bacterium]